MNQPSHKHLFPLSTSDFLFALGLGLIGLALYVRTLAPSLLWGDSAEFQTLSYTLGMTHPTGYVTQIMLGKIFTLIPVKNIAYRVNLMSAFFSAFAVANVYLIVRLLGGWKLGGTLASLALMVSTFYWRRAIIAESYAPAAGMLTIIWLFVLLWRRTEKWGWLCLAGIAGGLSIGIHSTVIMTGASVLVYMLMVARKRSAWMGAIAGAILGLALTFTFFLYLDHNDPPSSIYNTTYRTNLAARGLTQEEFNTPISRLLAIFPARSFWVYYFSANPKEIHLRVNEYIRSFPLWQFVSISLGALALLVIPKDNQWLWREGLYPLIAFFLIWGFAITVEFSVYKEFYMPMAPIVYVWLGIGVSTLQDGVSWFIRRWKENDSRLSQILPNLLGLVLVGLSLWHAKGDLSLAIQAGYTPFIRQEHIYPVFAPDKAVRDAQKILNKVEDNAIIFANWDRLYSYVYTAHILDGRTGISFHEEYVTEPPTLGSSTMEYIKANFGKRPIYFTEMLPELNKYYQLEKVQDGLFRLVAIR